MIKIALKPQGDRVQFRHPTQARWCPQHHNGPPRKTKKEQMQDFLRELSSIRFSSLTNCCLGAKVALKSKLTSKTSCNKFRFSMTRFTSGTRMFSEYLRLSSLLILIRNFKHLTLKKQQFKQINHLFMPKTTTPPFFIHQVQNLHLRHMLH